MERRREVVRQRAAGAGERADQDDRDERGDLREREDVLNRLPDLDAAAVRGGEQRDEHDRERALDREPGHEHRAVDPWHEHRREARERDRDGGDRPRLDDEEERPAVEKPDERPERLA